MAIVNLKLRKYRQEGDLQHTYCALKNKVNKDNSISEFNTNELSIDLNNPLNIECQPSYDGTVNLIINDDKNPPRIINSRFTKIEDGRYRIITRNQKQQTNLYQVGKIDQQTRLFRNINNLPKIGLIGISHAGQLKGGNYTFYIKFADNDFNQTDIVAESGQVSIFHGDFYKVESISGTLQDERTDKSITLNISNIDTSFSNMYIYYTREYSDVNGFRFNEAAMLQKPYPIKNSSEQITINGFEPETPIGTDQLNIKYNIVTNVKTQAQVQNMLFFGNVEADTVNVKDLQNISYFIDVKLKQKEHSIGWVDSEYKATIGNNLTELEYYNPQNIYYNVGYWPDEIYRLGIVYIMNDDSLSPVFNLRGCEFTALNESNITSFSELFQKDENGEYKTDIYGNKIMNYLERDEFIINDKYLANTMGVFKNPKETNDTVIQNYTTKQVKPWYYHVNISSEILKTLKTYKVKGCFLVRQKRIPTILGQGLSVGIDRTSYIPMLYDDKSRRYVAESFLSSNGLLVSDYTSHEIKTEIKQGSGLLSLDACVNPILQSMFDGSEYVLDRVYNNVGNYSRKDRHITISFDGKLASSNLSIKAGSIFVNTDVPIKVVNDYAFSTRAGAQEDIKQFGFFGKKDYDKDNYALVRGIYCPYIGVLNSLTNNSLYNIKIKNYSQGYLKEYFKIRGNDNSGFYAITDRYEINTNINRELEVYRGDCYTNTVTFRLNRNFIDSDVPINEIIVNSRTWKENYEGYMTTDAEKWMNINRADINTVPLGSWVTFKCLSSYNLGLRSYDRTYVDEQALMGNPRAFYPLNDISTKVSTKIEESWRLNSGYSATVGQKAHLAAQNLPYIKDQFDNRIMFSNVQVDDEFRNAYRIFQGLSYQDIDRQYGAIVKLIPWGTNLFCVFEHGIGIVPVNEKALIQTNTQQSIHMYGAGVLQNQITLISPDFGSIWPESIIRTPIGIYGVDTFGKKIWRFSDSKGFETISDMKIQKFLNDNIKLREEDKYPTIALRNVKTHYNNYKGDVMFTFYNFTENTEWNFCFNERMDQWVTRYSWTPLYSENINNIFYSLDKKRAEVLGYIYDNRNTKFGIRTNENEWKCVDGELTDTFKTLMWFEGNSILTDCDIVINKVTSSYIDDSEKEIYIALDVDDFKLTKVNPNQIELSWNKSDLWNKYGTDIPYYYKFDITATPYTDAINDDTDKKIALNALRTTVCVVIDHNYNSDKYLDLLGNGFYVHGRAGIFDEIDYEDENPDNQIKPTMWYDKQEPFEFEFVVNSPVGLHKIFDNLVIISNKVQPEEIEFEVIGDVYGFKKSGLFKSGKGFKNTKVKYDQMMNQYTLVTSQECKNIENPKYGRRLGNIHYKEDSWYLTIDPIKYDPKFVANSSDKINWSSTRIRDKFIKIRVKYSGKDLVIITALKTLINLSYA